MATLELSAFAKSSASLKHKWCQDLAKRFLNEGRDVEPNDLNAGIIGYSFDIMANAIEDAYFNINTRAKETFSITAKFDDSVFLHAISNSVHDFLAKPAYIDILIGVREAEIIANAIPRPGLGYKMLTISRDTQLVLDRFSYVLDYPIDIIVKEGSNNRKLISSKYNLSVRNHFSDIEATYIHGKVQRVNGENYYVFKTKARQMIKDSQTYIFTSSAVESDTYTVPYESQLAGIEVYYQENIDSDWVLLENKYLGVLTDIVGKKFCYYRLMDGEFEISFSTNPEHFKPAFNSRIKINTYITEGTLGNFDYTSDMIYIYLAQDSTDQYQSAFSGIIPVVQLLNTASRGGKDKPTMDDIRASIVEMKSSRKTISSDMDLKKAMEAYSMQIVKQRDDIYAREFMTFVLLQDQESDYTIPTRTGEIFIPEGDTTNQPEVDARLVSPDNVYNFWLADDSEYYNTNRFVSVSPDENGKSPTVALRQSDWKYLYDKYYRYGGVLMMCPFLIKIFKDPYFVALYDVQCAGSTGMVFGYNNYNSPEKFSINGVTVLRKDVRSNIYTISCEVAVSDIVMQSFISSDINDFAVRVKLEMLDSSEETYAYVDLTTVSTNSDGSKLIFSVDLVTDNILHNEDMIRIINKTIIPTADDTYTGTGIIPDKYFIPFKTKLRAYIAYKPDTPFDSEYHNYMLNEREVNDGFVITDMFETADPFQFVRDVSNVFSTVLEVIVADGVYPKYAEDVIMTYDQVIYDRNPDGTIRVDGANQLVILHNIGEVVMDGTTPLIAHKKGDPIIQFDSNNKPIYEVQPSRSFVIKNIPMVSMLSMINDQFNSVVYKTFRNATDTIQHQIIPKLIENNTIRIGVYNTIGPSALFVQGYGTDYSQLKNLDVSISLNIKLNNNDNRESIHDDIVNSVRAFMKTVMQKGYFYMDELIEYLKTTYSDIKYVEFANINNLDTKVQTIKINPDIDAAAQVPEYISVGQTLNADAFKKDGTVSFEPNIHINIVL